MSEEKRDGTVAVGTMKDINTELRNLRTMLNKVELAGDMTTAKVRELYTTPIQKTDELLRRPDLKIAHLRLIAEQYRIIISRFDMLGKFSPGQESSNEKIRAIEQIKNKHKRLNILIRILETMEKDFDVTVIIGQLEEEKQEYEERISDAEALKRVYMQTKRDNSLEVAVARRAYRRINRIEEKYKDNEEGILDEEKRISGELAELGEIVSRNIKFLKQKALQVVQNKIGIGKNGEATKIGKKIEAMLDEINVTIKEDDLARIVQLIKNTKDIPGFASDMITGAISIIFMDKVERVMLENIKLRVSTCQPTNQEGNADRVGEQDAELEALKCVLEAAQKSSIEFEQLFFCEQSEFDNGFGGYVDRTLEGHRGTQRKIDMLKLGIEDEGTSSANTDENQEKEEEQDSTNVIKLRTLTRKQKIEMTYKWLIERGQAPIVAFVNSRKDEVIQSWEEEFTRKQRLDQNPETEKQARELVKGRKETFLREVRLGVVAEKGKIGEKELTDIQAKAYKKASEFELEDPEATVEEK